MTELSPDARALIEQARRQGPGLMGPSARDRARLREKLAPGWRETPAPRTPAFVWSSWTWKRQAASSLLLIAGLGLLGWFLQSPPTSDTAESAGAAQPSAASASAPAATAMIEHGPTTPVTPSVAPVPEAGPESQSAAALPGHVPARKTTGVSGRDRTRSAPASKAIGDAREPTLSSAQTSSPAQANAHAKPGQAESKQRNLEREQTTSASSDAARADTPKDDAAAQSARDQELPLVAAAADGRARAVKTDSRPGPRSIDGELELLGEAQTMLQAHRPSRALNLLQEHAFRFPAGALADERMAMQALALCALDRKNAAASVLSSLEARGSRSALLPRVRRQCGL